MVGTVEQAITITSGNSVEISSNPENQNGPLSSAKRSNEIPILRYPLDLGNDQIYKHVMRINIYRQNHTKFEIGVLGLNAFDESKAGASKTQKIGGADLAAAGGLVLGKEIVTSLPGNIGKLSDTAIKAAQGVTGLASLGTGIDLTRKTEKESIAYISLYMPETLQFTDRHDFDPVSVTEAMGSAGIVESVGDGGVASGEAAGRATEAAGIVGQGYTDLNLFGKGYALNPQLEILYKGSKNRQFIFSFKFTPRNQKEAEIVESIIRTLRFHAAPEYSKELKSSRYFIPPSEFDIEFFMFSERNKHIPRIAQCVLENVDVNYAAAGQYSTFADGMPVEISMQLTFTETVILTKDDIDSGF